MTVVILYAQGETLHGFCCQGHAGYAPAGSDIVCAGVSALTATCVNALESVAGIQVRLVRRPEDAYLQALLPRELSREQHHDAQVLLKALRQCIGDLAAQYPNFVQLSIQEWRKSP
jgi:uncharacterized protein YsxB (DUF464 family)